MLTLNSSLARISRTCQSLWQTDINGTCAYSCCAHPGSNPRTICTVEMKSNKVRLKHGIAHTHIFKFLYGMIQYPKFVFVKSCVTTVITKDNHFLVLVSSLLIVLGITYSNRLTSCYSNQHLNMITTINKQQSTMCACTNKKETDGICFLIINIKEEKSL